MSLLFDPNHVILSEHQSNQLFNALLVVSQFSGGLAILLVAIWMGGYEDGFAWQEDPERQFHYHPTFMVMGMVFLYGESLLVYRVFRNERKRTTKLLHVVLHSMVMVFMIIALKAVWDNHDLHRAPDGSLDPLPNLYSLHSWIGLLTVISYSMQYAAGFATFFFPGLPIPVRQMVMPFHQLFGQIIFIAVSIAVAMGISERAAWKHTCWTKEREFCGQHAVSNYAGLSIFVYSACVLLLVANPRWKRRPLPEEESLHQLTASSSAMTNLE